MAALPAVVAGQPAYTFSVLAGSGGESGSADGPVTAASFLTPWGAATDLNGNLYIADFGNSTIRKITPAGEVTTLAGAAGQSGSADGNGANARFHAPAAVAVDASGNLYVADYGNSTVRKITPAGDVTTLAGVAGQTGSDDGNGSSARFFSPIALTIGQAGNIYVADDSNSTIRKITPAGVVTTLAGQARQYGSTDGNGANARFAHPAGIAADALGNLYVADGYNQTIRKVTPDGIVTTLAGAAGSAGTADGAAGVARFHGPKGIAVGTNGIIYVSDSDSNTLRTIAPNGTVATLVGRAGQTGLIDGQGADARFNHPAGLTLTTAGSVVVVETGNNAIRLVTPGGGVTTLTGGAGGSGDAGGSGPAARFFNPLGSAVGPDGTIYVADWSNKTVRRVTVDGVVSPISESLGEFYAYGLAVDGTGTVYAADRQSQVYKVTPDGTVSVLAGGPTQGAADGTGAAARFMGPKGVAVDGNGNVYVADTYNNLIRKISPGGLVTTLGGAFQTGSNDGPVDQARFYRPQGVAVDRMGSIYVADTGNNTIRKISPNGLVSTVAGNAWASGSADGTGSAARFLNPQSVAVDADGNLYVADTGNHTIRHITPDGVVTTIGGLAGFADFHTGTGSAAHFVSPQSVSVSPDGLLYVVDSGYNSVLVGSNQGLPTVTGSPGDRTITETQTTTFSVTTSGGYLNYQWRKGGVPIAGATAASLTLSNITSADAGTYDVVIANHLGTATSAPAALAVTPLAFISSASPTRQVLRPGKPLSLAVTATGNGSLSYQWSHNGVAIAGANNPGLTIPAASRSDAGWYLVSVTDNNGTRPSAPFFVSVTPALTQVRAWGANGFGQSNVPVGLSGVIAVAASGEHVLALKGDGSVVAWGFDYNGQCKIPSGLTDVVGIAAGAAHSLALKSDGTVVAWGYNVYGQCAVPAGLADVVAIAARGYASFALKADGTLVAWGDPPPGQPADLGHVVGLAAGGTHVLALQDDGRVVAWGDNADGATTVPAGLTGVVGLAADWNFSLALTDLGNVQGWGSNAAGQLNVPTGLSNVTMVAAGSYFAVALKSDGTVSAWGRNFDGESTPPADLTSGWAIAAGGAVSVALRDASTDSAPTLSASPADQTAVEYQGLTLSVTASGTGPLGYQWRKNGEAIAGATSPSLFFANLTLADGGSYDVVVFNHVGSITSPTAMLTVKPIPVVTASSPTRQVLAPGQSLALTVAATGTGTLHYQWLHNGRPVAGATSAAYSIPATTVADSGSYVVAITDDNGTRYAAPIFAVIAPPVTQVRAWGSGAAAVPTGLSDAVAVDGSGYGLALKRDGTVVGWGGSAYSVAAAVPAGLSDVVAISGKYQHALALKSDGTLAVWDGPNAPPTPVPGGLVNLIAVAAEGGRLLALRNDGTVAEWIINYNNPPQLVPNGVTQAASIAAGYAFAVALKRDGTVTAWGDNGFGQTNVPAGLSTVVAIAAGENHALALKDNGTVAAWGRNSDGQTNVPAGLSHVVAIAAAGNYSLALQVDGAVVAWGSNSDGQTAVPGDLTKVFTLGTGSACAYALRDATGDTTPAIVAAPAAQTVAETSPVTFAVTATGAGPLSYQWRKDGVVLGGATASTLTLPSLALADAGNYDVVVSNHAGSTTSAPAALVVNPIPVVTATAPARNVLTPGQATSLGVTATGTGALSYQWIHNGRPVTSATSPSLALTNASNRDAGWYVVLVTDTFGTRYSAPFFVTVAPIQTQLRAWGTNYFGESTVPAGLNDVVAVSAGRRHGLGLRRNGTVVAWGGSSSN